MFEAKTTFAEIYFKRLGKCMSIQVNPKFSVLSAIRILSVQTDLSELDSLLFDDKLRKQLLCTLLVFFLSSVLLACFKKPFSNTAFCRSVQQ